MDNYTNEFARAYKIAESLVSEYGDKDAWIEASLERIKEIKYKSDTFADELIDAVFSTAVELLEEYRNKLFEEKRTPWFGFSVYICGEDSHIYAESPIGAYELTCAYDFMRFIEDLERCS